MTVDRPESVDVSEYRVKEVEQKWQRRWRALDLGEVDPQTIDKKYYVLTMFPYPSGDRLHMGHWYQYGIVDSWARFQGMRGKTVFQPMGFDAFGLPAENYAVKNGIHPAASTSKNVAIMMRQFEAMGVSYSWRHSLNTSAPEYYRWSQWLFLQMFNNGLAYRRNAPVNWCPGCQTVLANEQVHRGLCERCESHVIQKDMQQWFFRITRYSQRLLDNLPLLEWPEGTKTMQAHWIGRSEGWDIFFPVLGTEHRIQVFTSHSERLYGVSYIALAPEHPLVPILTSEEQQSAVCAYRNHVASSTELARVAAVNDVSGVFTGAFATNPANGEALPIWVADYVLATYASGAVMGVPAHDERDFAFARRFDLPIRTVVVEGDAAQTDVPFTAFGGEGTTVASGPYSGQSSLVTRQALSSDLEAAGHARARVTFRLRDWLVSRQRYWGAPIPIIHCNVCGEVPVPETDLPVCLPTDVDFRPTGESPLRRSEEFMNVGCPRCGRPAQREADTMDTFVCSSWYFLRFPSVGDDTVPFDPTLTQKMLPVDHYVGGQEHACMHLLYARFVTMVLKDLGHLTFEEPFPRLTHQGLVLGKDGQKMSKSRSNSVSPDGYVEQHGSDCLRMYLMFGFNYVDGGPWDDGGVAAIGRYRDRLHRLFVEQAEVMRASATFVASAFGEDERLLLHVYHSAIARISADAERFQFNTCIARLMELLNAITRYLRDVPPPRRRRDALGQVLRGYVVLIAPFAPHFAEEHYARMGGAQETVFKEQWPTPDPCFLDLDATTLAVMVNGKLRDQITVARSANEEQISRAARASHKASRFLEGKLISRTILVPGKLINFIIKEN